MKFVILHALIKIDNMFLSCMNQSLISFPFPHFLMNQSNHNKYSPNMLVSFQVTI